MLPKPTNTILPANFTCTSCVLITLISFWCALSFWSDFHDARRADAASLPGGTQNSQVSVNFLEFGVKFVQRNAVRDGDRRSSRPVGQEASGQRRSSCPETSCPTGRVLDRSASRRRRYYCTVL